MRHFNKNALLMTVLLPLMAQALPFVPTTDPLSSTTHWYHIKTENVYLYADFGDLWATPTASTAEPYLWCFVGDESTGYTIYNRGAQYYMAGVFVNGRLAMPTSVM